MNINYRQLFIAVLFVILSATPVWAGGIGLYEIGAPDTGTASAGRAAHAQDASTAFGNPAGMTKLERSQILIGIQELILTAKFDIGEDTENALFGANAASGGDGGDIGGITPAGGFYYVQNILPELRAGLSLNSYAGLGIDYDDNWVGRYYVQEAELLTVNINPALAYQINDWLSIGTGGNIMFAKFHQKAAIRTAIAGDGRVEFQDETVGYGGNAGILIEPMEGTRLGVTYRSPVELEFEDTIDIENIGPTLTSALQSRGLLDSEVEIDVTIPQEVMFSVYHEINEKLAIMANGGWQNWEEFGKSDITVRANNTTELETDRNLRDTWHVALGIQRRITDLTLLSLGAAFDSSPVSDNDRTPDLAVDRQIRAALGLQHDLSKDVTIGCAYEYVDLGDARIDQETGPLTGRLQGSYGPNHIQIINANLVWKF